jgi:hypothetical protein
VLSRIVELEHAVGDAVDAALNFLGAVGERRLVRPELRSPALLPVLDDLTGGAKLIARVGIEPAEVPPDDLAVSSSAYVRVRAMFWPSILSASRSSTFVRIASTPMSSAGRTMSEKPKSILR